MTTATEPLIPNKLGQARNETQSEFFFLLFNKKDARTV
jgi:hypothetical protein